ncbi:hypothetical protein QOT17_004050 [Balamuthia mandrillaris]
MNEGCRWWAAADLDAFERARPSVNPENYDNEFSLWLERRPCHLQDLPAVLQLAIFGCTSTRGKIALARRSPTFRAVLLRHVMTKTFARKGAPTSSSTLYLQLSHSTRFLGKNLFHPKRRKEEQSWSGGLLCRTVLTKVFNSILPVPKNIKKTAEAHQMRIKFTVTDPIIDRNNYGRDTPSACSPTENTQKEIERISRRF